MLSWVMPYDAEAQTFHLDLAISNDGLTFKRVQQDGHEPVKAVTRNHIEPSPNSTVLNRHWFGHAANQTRSIL